MNLLSAKPLRVFPNPYLMLDHKGLPASAARRDPDFEISAGMRLYVAAEISEVKILKERDRGEKAAGLAPMLQELVWRFVTDKPTEIEDTQYHRALLKNREILPADEATHRRAFGPNGKLFPFIEPTKALTAARAAAIETWKSEHDGEEPAFVELEKAPKAAPAAEPSTET